MRAAATAHDVTGHPSSEDRRLAPRLLCAVARRRWSPPHAYARQGARQGLRPPNSARSRDLASGKRRLSSERVYPQGRGGCSRGDSRACSRGGSSDGGPAGHQNRGNLRRRGRALARVPRGREAAEDRHASRRAQRGSCPSPPRFGAETPLRDPRDGRDTFRTDDIDDFRRELLATHLSPRTVQGALGPRQLRRLRPPAGGQPHPGRTRLHGAASGMS